MGSMAERELDEVRDFAVRFAHDEDVDYIESAYEDEDLEDLRQMALAVARYSGQPVPCFLAEHEAANQAAG